MDNSKFSFNSDSITATVSLFKTKIVPLNIAAINDKDSHGTIDSVSFNPEQITVAGPDSILNKTDELKIDLPIKIDITNNNSSEMSKTININDFLPENIILASKEEKITVNIKFTPYAKKDILVKTSSIKSKNLNENYKLSFNNETFSVTFIAPEKEISKLNESNISSSFDFLDYTQGEYEITPKISSNKFFAYTEEKINCKIQKK